MKFKTAEIADVKIMDRDGNVLFEGEVYNTQATPREIALAKQVRELEKKLEEKE